MKTTKNTVKIAGEHWSSSYNLHIPCPQVETTIAALEHAHGLYRLQSNSMTATAIWISFLTQHVVLGESPFDTTYGASLWERVVTTIPRIVEHNPNIRHFTSPEAIPLYQ